MDLTWLLRVGVLIAVMVLVGVWVYRLGKARRSPGPTAEVPQSEVLDPLDPRSLFRRLQAWCATAHRPRIPSETPDQYGRSLGERVPEAATVCAAVCGVYDDARYGMSPASEPAVRSAAKALNALVQQGPLSPKA